MQTSTTTSGTSLLGLVRVLREQTRRLIKEEFQLAKAELSEKFSHLGRNSAAMAAGALIAYAGLIVFLAGLGALLAFAFEQAGMQPMLAGFLGLAVIGLLFAAVGGAFVLKGLKSLSKESLAPEKTLHTLQELKGAEPAKKPAAPATTPKPTRSPAELEASIVSTENRIDATLKELKRRFSREYVGRQVGHKYHSHPYRWNVMVMVMGMLGGLSIGRKFRHSKA